MDLGTQRNDSWLTMVTCRKMAQILTHCVHFDGIQRAKLLNTRNQQSAPYLHLFIGATFDFQARLLLVNPHSAKSIDKGGSERYLCAQHLSPRNTPCSLSDERGNLSRFMPRIAVKEGNMMRDGWDG